jgi:hypothetical protein
LIVKESTPVPVPALMKLLACWVWNSIKNEKWPT